MEVEGESRGTSFRGVLQFNQAGCSVKPPLRPQFHKRFKAA